MVDVLIVVLVSLVTVDVITILSAVIIERNDPDKIVAWTVIALIIPFIGALGYFIIGQRISLYGLYSDKRRKESVINRLEADTGIPSLNPIEGVSTSYRNNVMILTDGKVMFTMLKEDIDSSKESIFMEYYIIINDNLGNSIIDALCRKAEEGVDVMLIGDGFGFRKLSKESLTRVKDSGTRFTYINRPSFHSLNPRTNNCDHRKMIVIDGHITYCSGLNVTDDYVGSGHLGNWRDSAVRIEGDIAEHAQRKFLTTWAYATNSDIISPQRSEKGFQGNEKVSLIYGGPDLRPNPILEHYREIILSAKNELLIETPYLTNVELIKALMKAAESGVDVKVIIPGRPDHWFTFWNNCHSAKKAIRSGVRFFLYDGGFLHSKMVVADGMISSLGSANFDDRTAYFNFDANMMFHSEDIAKRMIDIFDEDLEKCRPFEPKEYSGIVASVKTFICNIVRPLA